MTYIELVRAVSSRVGMQASGPASISGAVGAEADLVNAVSDAYSDIQNSREEWLWLRDQTTFPTVSGTTTYAPYTIFQNNSNNRMGRWKRDSIYFLDGSTNRSLCNSFVPYDDFIYRHKNDTVNKKPYEFTIRPQDDAIIINRPDGAYTVTIDYWKKPQVLTTDNSVPEMPSQFHLVIVYEAIAKYAATIGSPDLYDKFSYDHAKLYGSLQRRELSKKSVRLYGLA